MFFNIHILLYSNVIESKLLLLFAFVSAHSCNDMQCSRINTRLLKITQLNVCHVL